MCHDVPYTKYSRLIVQSLVEGVVGLVKYFPSNNSVSDQMYLSIIVEVKLNIDAGLKF